MSIFDSLQDLFGGITDTAQGTIGDTLGGIVDNPIVQDAQEHVATVTDGAQTAIDDVTQKLGL